ncbi:MAG: transposase, partial [Archangium sp.]|nr:transposase [Archangium sp.]
KCAYEDAALKSLCDDLARLSPTLVVVEATGGLEQRIAAELNASGEPLAVVKPRQERNFARECGELAKTDSIDARTLSSFARADRLQVMRGDSGDRALHEVEIEVEREVRRGDGAIFGVVKGGGLEAERMRLVDAMHGEREVIRNAGLLKVKLAGVMGNPSPSERGSG